MGATAADSKSPERAGSREDSGPVAVIRAGGGWRGLGLREVWDYREVLYFLAWRDVKVRYKQTLFGAAWALFQPILMTAVFAFVLRRYARVESPDTPYPLFVYTGMLAWIFFSTAITASGNSVVASERVVTKVWFPRLCIPFASVLACLVDLAIASSVLAVLMAVYGYAPSLSVLALPWILLVLILAAMGAGALLSALMVAYRDVRFVLPFLVQILMFATPSIYIDTRSPGPDRGFGWLDLHPLHGLIDAFRSALLGGALDWPRLAVSSAIGLSVFLLGCLYFRRVEDAFADII